MFQCKKCNTQIPRNRDGKRAETLIIICPVCHSIVEASSCYGFGPVWPACFYCGDRLVAEFRKTGAYRDNHFELKILGETVPFILDEELRKDNYKRYSEICNRIMDLLRERKLI